MLRIKVLLSLRISPFLRLLRAAKWYFMVKEQLRKLCALKPRSELHRLLESVEFCEQQTHTIREPRFCQKDPELSR